jgi:xylitol oxidase
MNRKEFIKTSSYLAALGLVSPLSSCNNSSMTGRKNWGGNYTFGAKELVEPEDFDELMAILKTSSSQKAIGSRHSFNGIADSPMKQISLRRLNKMLEVNEDAMTVRVQGGIRYEELAPQLDNAGYALHNLASLPQVTVAGACCTATHGSGRANKNLAASISGMQFISGKGEMVTLTREKDKDMFNGAVVHLGGIGVVTELTLEIQKSFEVRQDLYQDLPFAEVIQNFNEIMSSGYSVSLFTEWQNQEVSQVWIKRRTDQSITDFGNEFYGGKAATKNLHPVTRFSSEACTQQMGVEGPWYDRLPHFKMGALPANGNEIQSEYFVPYENAVDAVAALEKKGDIIFPELLISEIRTVAADNLWMSPSYQQDCLALHFTWKPNWERVKRILPVIEAELAPYGVRPHWGKTFALNSDELHQRIDRLNDFVDLIKHYDPDGKFRNAYLENNIFH